MKPLRVQDFLVSSETFFLKHDPETGALQTTPDLTQETRQKYYPKDTYLSYADKANGLKETLYLWAKKTHIQTKLKRIAKVKRPGTLLDFGAGNGAFALGAQAKGWEVTAIDYSETAKKLLTKKGIPQINEIHQNHKFDVITLWHVFEHLPNPKDHLLKFYESLAPGGILVLALPNHKSWDATHYGPYWAAYDVPRHLWHYSKESIYGLAKEADFSILKTHNMFWDAFYIALVSEQYKKSKYPWLLGFIKGLYSNVIGWSQKNTSSLTFILQKPK